MCAALAIQAETRFGGMTVRDAFTDQRVVRLIEAVGRGDTRDADTAIRDGADVNTVGKEGISPLLWVLGTHNLNGMEYLLKAGADPNYRETKNNYSAMFLAAGGNRPELLELLLKHRGNPNLLGPNDETMLQVAIGQLREQNIELLLKYGADINARTRWSTAAQSAVAVGRFDWAAKFLELGLNTDLERLARAAQISQVPAASPQQRWKEKVLEMLKARGIAAPAKTPRPPGATASPKNP